MIFKRRLVTKQLTVAIDFYLFLHTMEVSGLVTNIVENIFFCAQQNKETHTVLQHLEVELSL